VEKTIETLKASNLVLYVVDAREGIKAQERQWLALADKTIVVMNKKDLVEGAVHAAPGYDMVCISAKFALGIDELLTAMRQAFPHDQPLVFLDRHAYLLNAIQEGFTADVLTIDLKHALDHLRQMTGETADEDILERIFSRFCIGK
jgi:tRNA modification GTPase